MTQPSKQNIAQAQYVLSACKVLAKRNKIAQRAITRIHRARTRHLVNRDHATSSECKWT